MRAQDLGLTGAAKAAATRLERDHPDLVFTSGRRSVAEQARAMAANVLRNRRWIEATYAATAESRSLQAWLDDHPAAAPAGEIADGLATIMSAWSDDRKARLSKHFSGQAFDVRPVGGARGAIIKAAIRCSPGLTKFLEREGGLVRWHAQFE